MKEGTNNLFLLFFSWWYSYLPHRLFLAFKAASITLADLFSVKILFLTLLSPWKRDIISTEGLTLQQKFQVWMLNISSRVVGFLVKISVLAAFLIIYSLTLGIFLSFFTLWLAFPLVVASLFVLGFINFKGSY